MLVPDPSDLFARIVLIARQPQLAPLADDIKDLASHVCEIRKASLAPRSVDIELVNRSGQEKNFDALGSATG